MLISIFDLAAIFVFLSMNRCNNVSCFMYRYVSDACRSSYFAQMFHGTLICFYISSQTDNVEIEIGPSALDTATFNEPPTLISNIWAAHTAVRLRGP